MATLIDKVIEITLTYGSAVIETARFDIPLIISSHSSTQNNVDVFTSPDAMLQAGFTSDSPAYTMASLIFSGVGAAGQVVIGKRDLSNFSVNITPVSNFTYTVTLKSGLSSKVFTFVSDNSATAAEIGSGIQALIAGDSVWSSKVTVSSTGSTLTVTPNEGQNVDISTSTNLKTVRNSDQDVLEALADISDINNTWFWVVSDSHEVEDVLAVAEYAQANDKIYWTSSQDVAVLNGADGNLLAQLSQAAYRNTGFAMFRTDADTTFPEAGVVGAMAAAEPGTTTLHGKTLIGVGVQKLTPTQETMIVAQNGNIYRREYGVNFYRDGRMVDGGFCDVVHHALWFKARLAESVFGLLKRESDLLKGVRFTSVGLAKIKQAIWENPINIGILNGSISNEVNVSDSGMREDLKPTISIPNRADIPANDIAQRVLNGVVVEYVYAGFVHYVKVKVNVLVDR